MHTSEVLCEVKFLAEEGLSHDGKVDRVDELEAHRQVLYLLNHVHGDLFRLTQEELVVLLLVLLLSQFEIIVVDYVLFVFPPRSDLPGGVADHAVPTPHLVADYEKADMTSKSERVPIHDDV